MRRRMYQPPVTPMVVGRPDPTAVVDDRLVRFYQHVQPGKPACGQTWGEMAPPDNRPGMLHWCSRPVAGHPGKHRCVCGSYHTGEGVVICRFPADKIDGPECGQAVTGTQRDVIKPGAGLGVIASRRRVGTTGELITSTPCGHPVRRGF